MQNRVLGSEEELVGGGEKAKLINIRDQKVLLPTNTMHSSVLKANDSHNALTQRYLASPNTHTWP